LAQAQIEQTGTSQGGTESIVAAAYAAQTGDSSSFVSLGSMTGQQQSAFAKTWSSAIDPADPYTMNVVQNFITSTAPEYASVVNISGAGTTQYLVSSGPSGGTVDGDPEYMQQSTQSFVAYNSLTSQQMSDALYAGGGLSDEDLSGTSGTFAQFTSEQASVAQNLKSFASQLTDWVAQGTPAVNNGDPGPTNFWSNLSAAKATQMATNNVNKANAITANVAALSNAFANHALTFTNAADVQGLDYQATVWSQASGGSVSSGEGSESSSFNTHYMLSNVDPTQVVNDTAGASNGFPQEIGSIGGIVGSDGKHYQLAQIGDVELMLSH
jgi:hypothetical protein